MQSLIDRYLRTQVVCFDVETEYFRGVTYTWAPLVTAIIVLYEKNIFSA